MEIAEIVFLEPDMPEWKYAWAMIKRTFGDYACTAGPEGGYESWQYMGTVRKDWRRIEHQFRHRALPPTHKREYFNFPASEGFHIENGINSGIVYYSRIPGGRTLYKTTKPDPSRLWLGTPEYTREPVLVRAGVA